MKIEKDEDNLVSIRHPQGLWGDPCVKTTPKEIHFTFGCKVQILRNKLIDAFPGGVIYLSRFGEGEICK